jgi:ubiquinone/menaquinone biosynthesis C-methylase UbiE
MTSQTQQQPDLSIIRARQQKTWASGDFAVVASRIVLASEQLADVMDLHAGWHVLDVACGSGNATLAAARSGTQAVGVDYVPALLEDGRARAAAEGLDVEFRTAEAESLPFDDSTFDAALTVFGTMFAADHQKAADEIVRVVRPTGTLGLASWRPTGFIGEMFGVITSYVPAPAGVTSPMRWGTEEYLNDLFGPSIAAMTSAERTCIFRFTSPEEFVAFFRRWYGPTLKAFETLDEVGQAGLARDLTDLAGRWDRHTDASVAIPATYLESVLTLR